MNNAEIIFFGVMVFAGIFFGWFFKTLNPFKILIGFILFGSFLDLLIKIDHWMFTLPFIVGFLFQCGKPILEKIRS